MATPTTNYNLLKPQVGETYNVQTFNDNFDKIDSAVFNASSGNGTVKIKHAEWLRANQSDAPANTNWGPGLFNTLVDSTHTSNNTFVGGTVNDQLKILEDGLYTFFWRLTNAGGLCDYTLSTDDGSGNLYAASPTTTLATGKTLNLPIPNLRLHVNDIIQVRYTCSAPTVPVNHLFKLTKIQG